MSDENGIYISKKQASVSAAVFIVLGLLIFIGGYFWGKQSVIDGFSQKATQESFNDQVDYLLTMQSFAEKNGGIGATEEELATRPTATSSTKVVSTKVEPTRVEPTRVALATDELEVPEVLKNLSEAALTKKSSTSKVEQSKMEPSRVESKQNYYATLVGFGKRASAVQFQNRLKKHNINVEIQQKTSKSASGKVTRTWFQVVTKSYDSKQELQNHIDKIVNLEKIKRSDIKIV
ncbi:MAG: hypothetical protein WC747_03270 [Candidatus Babeliales bacterium]|jgi:hypothetical protein